MVVRSREADAEAFIDRRAEAKTVTYDEKATVRKFKE